MADYKKLAEVFRDRIPYPRPSYSMPVNQYYSAEALWTLHDAILDMAGDD